MERDGCMGGNAASTTPKVWTKAILTPIYSGRLLAIWAGRPWWKSFVPEKFNQNAMSSTKILFEKLILSLTRHIIIEHLRRMFILTFPTVLERLGIWCVAMLSSASAVRTPGDHALFFEGDTLREGDGSGCESFTGTCATRLPRRVCVVVTSNISGFCAESLIFGIWDCKGRSRRDDDGTQWRRWNDVNNNAIGFKVIESAEKVHVLPYQCMWRTGMQFSAGQLYINTMPSARGKNGSLIYQMKLDRTYLEIQWSPGWFWSTICCCIQS